MRLLCLDRKEVEEFYEVYRDVVNEYSAMVDELSQGPSLILEIKGEAAADHVQKSFREFCGPADTKVAQENGLSKNNSCKPESRVSSQSNLIDKAQI